MPTRTSHRRPEFRVHDQRPILRGLSALLLCVVFLLSFILTLAQGTGAPVPPLEGAGRSAQRGS